MAELSPEATKQLAELSIGLANNPKTRKEFVGLVKKIDPSRSFPDVDTEEMRESIKQEFTDRDAQAAAARVTQRLSDQRAGLISSGRFSEDEVKVMEKDVMEKHGISDYDVAAKVYAADKKPANPTPEIKSRLWEMPVMDKAALGNLNNHARNEAYKAIDELQSNKRRA